MNVTSILSYCSHQLVIHPETTHRIVDSRIDHHRRFVRILICDLLIHLINMAKNIEQQLRSSGKITRGWLGVMIQDVDEELARQFGSGERHGALVSEVSPGSPAEKGGLQQGDLIVAMNGRKALKS